LEDLCRWYASRLDLLLSKPSAPEGDPELAAEVAQLRRDMALLNHRLADQTARAAEYQELATRAVHALKQRTGGKA
jgi:hypothetical protein